MDTTLELTWAEHALLLKLLKRHLKWFRSYGAVAPQYVDTEEWGLTNVLK